MNFIERGIHAPTFKVLGNLSEMLGFLMCELFDFIGSRVNSPLQKEELPVLWILVECREDDFYTPVYLAGYFQGTA